MSEVVYAHRKLGEVRNMAEKRTDVIAYLRVSTEKQGASGLGMDAQRDAIERAANYKGWNVVEWIEDEASGKNIDRPGIQEALELIEDSGPKVLVAAKLDRIARSALDFLTIVERAKENDWSLVVLDMGTSENDEMDMTNPYGKFSATILAAVAELERAMISQRTKDALAKKRARGEYVGGVRVPDDVRARIVREREAGATLRTIANELNRDGIPTARDGKRWYHSTVKRVLESEGVE